MKSDFERARDKAAAECVFTGDHPNYNKIADAFEAGANWALTWIRANYFLREDKAKERCDRCGAIDFMVVRDMTSRRKCICGNEWACPPKKLATAFKAGAQKDE